MKAQSSKRITLLLVGLGNEGRAYQTTRHNLGRQFVNWLKTHSLLLPGVKPLTLPCLMNESGKYLAEWLNSANWWQIDRLVVIHDDLDLPFGRARLQFGRGTAGHKGVESIVASLGSNQFWRLRLGVGRPANKKEVVDYLLSPFDSHQRQQLENLFLTGWQELGQLFNQVLSTASWWQAFLRLASAYLNLEVAPGLSIPTPYWRNRVWCGRVVVRGPLGGKGKPRQIVAWARKRAEKEGVEFGRCSPRKLYQLFRRWRLGIDCSGLAFWLLDCLARRAWGLGKDWAKTLAWAPGRSNNPARRLNAHLLTSPPNAERISRTCFLRAGDLLRFRFGKSGDHLGVVLGFSVFNRFSWEELLPCWQKGAKFLFFLHSTRRQKPAGVRVEKVKIKNPKKEITKQQWPPKFKYYSEGGWRLRILV